MGEIWIQKFQRTHVTKWTGYNIMLHTPFSRTFKDSISFYRKIGIMLFLYYFNVSDIISKKFNADSGLFLNISL